MTKTVTSDEILTQLSPITRNPKAAIGVAFNLLEVLTEGGVVVVDASNAFAYSLTMGVINTHYGLVQAEAATRRLMPAMAIGMDELHLHMTDADYVGRFATPATTVAAFAMPLADILGNAVDLNDGSGARALVIPRHTSITSGNYTFNLQYPIVIKVLYNGTLSVYMDVTNTTPTYTPPTNIVKWVKQTYNEQDWILIDFPVQQVKIVSNIIQAISFTGYSSSFTYSDNFFYARAYIRDSAGAWKEIKVTHQDQSYNANTPTICLKVLENSVDAYIPQIYFQNSSITGSVRLDIYTTVGYMNVDMTKDQISSFKVKFEDLDVGTTKYSSPLLRMTNISAMIRTAINGGSAGKSFAKQYNEVILRDAYTEGLPITPEQIGKKITTSGYKLLTMIDNVVYKKYAATREIDPPSNKTTVTGLSCSMQNMRFTVNDIITSDVIFSNTKRATITPEMLFLYENGNVHRVSDTDLEALKSLTVTNPDGVANTLNNNQYYTTPFHYCLDMTSYTFGVRPYSLTNPVVTSRNLVRTNDTLGIAIASDGYDVIYKADGSGYIIYLTLEKSAITAALTADQLSVQLSYESQGSSIRAVIPGKLISSVDEMTNQPINGDWLFSFEILSTFDITQNHELDVSSTGFPIDLVSDIDVLYILKNINPMNSTISEIDNLIVKEKIPDYDYLSTYLGCSQERINVKFGTYLDTLWTRSNTVVAEEEYRRYEEDVYAYWDEDVYELVPGSDKVIRIDYDKVTGKITTYKLHSKGDPILDANGVHQLLHEKGSVIYDSSGKPVPIKSESDLTRYIDILLVDGKYYFANNELTTDYYREAIAQMTGWIEQDMPELNKRCLPQSSIHYYPQVNSGLIDVIVGDGAMARVRSDQSLSFVYTVRREKYNNAEIRKNLDTNTAALFVNALNSILDVGEGIVTKSDIVSVMKTLLKGDVLDIEIRGFLDDQFNSILISDVSSIPTVGKRLVTLSNLTLQVQDDVSVDYEVLDKEPFNTYTIRK